MQEELEQKRKSYAKEWQEMNQKYLPANVNVMNLSEDQIITYWGLAGARSQVELARKEYETVQSFVAGLRKVLGIILNSSDG